MYGFIARNGQVAPMICQLSNGYVTRYAFLQSGGIVGSYMEAGEEWDASRWSRETFASEGEAVEAALGKAA